MSSPSTSGRGTGDFQSGDLGVQCLLGLKAELKQGDDLRGQGLALNGIGDAFAFAASFEIIGQL